MDRFIIMLIGLLVAGALYSYIAGKFTTNKLILYLPSYIGIALIIYIFVSYNPGIGFEDLAKVISAMLVLPVIIGNTVTGIFLNRKKKS